MKFFIQLSILSISVFTLKAQEVDSEFIAKTYNSRLSKLQGAVLKEHDFFDLYGNRKTFADFKGKILYVDIWATWCKPCIAGFPHREQLLKRIKALKLDTAIQFITICTEESQKTWRKLVKQLNPSGINLYAKDTSVYDDLSINSFPTYLLIDDSGKILSANVSGPDDSVIDFILYAATKGIKPSDAIWIYFRQNQSYIKYKKFTDDDEGKAYVKWFDASMPLLVEYFQWKQIKKN